MYGTEYLADGVLAFSALAEHVFVTGLRPEFYAGHTRAFLAAVMLLLHHQVEFIKAIHPCAVFLLIVRQGLEQPHHGHAALMFQYFHVVLYLLS